MLRVCATVALASTFLACTLGAQEQSPRGSPADTVQLRYSWPTTGRLDLEFDGTLINENNGRRDSTKVLARFSLQLESQADGTELRLLHLTVAGDGHSAATLSFAAGDRSAPSALLGTDGSIISVAKIDAVVGYLATAFSEMDVVGGSAGADLRAELLALGTHKTVDTEVRRVWRDAIGFWLGADLPLGTWYTFADTAAVEFAPGKRLISTYEYRVAERLGCDATDGSSRCILVERDWTVDSALYRQSLNDAVRASLTTGTLLSAEFSESLQLLTRADSLLPAALQASRLLRTTARELNGTLSERRQWRRFLLRSIHRPGDSRLHAAARAGDVDGIASALAAGEFVDVADDSGRTPLLIAAMAGRDAAARSLLGSGADGARALDHARAQGDATTARRLYGLTRRPVPGRTLAAGQALADSLEFSRAVPLFVDAVVAEPEDLRAHRGLLEAKSFVFGHAALRADVEALLARAPCDPVALLVSSAIFISALDSLQTARDSVRVVGERAVACDSAAALGWVIIDWATHGGSLGAESELARARLVELTPITTQFSGTLRWVLDSLPLNAVLVLTATEDYVAAVRLQRAGVRQDVTVVRDPPPTPPADRAVVAPPWAAVWDSFAGAFEVSYVRQTSDGRWANSTARYYPFLRDAAPLFVGHVTDRSDWHRTRAAERLESRFALVVYRYLASLDAAAFGGDGRRLHDVDSASRLLARVAEQVPSTLAGYLEHAAGVQGRIAESWSALGYPWRSLSHARFVARTLPHKADSWLNLAYFSLAAGALDEADSALRVIDRRSPMLTTYLNRATVARLRGDGAGSLMALRRARAFLDSLGAAGADTVATWTMSRLPAHAADTLAVRATVTVSERPQREAFIRFNEALAQAMVGDRRAADRSVAAALAADDRAVMRCHAHSMSVATRGYAKPVGEALRWLEAFERRMLRGVQCPGSGAGRNVG